MQIQYFQTAWNDIKNSPGWFGKVCLLALVGIIPIFGQIVIYGYLYGWAREIAWGVHEPLPESIFANEDGKFYRRGWFIFVLAFVLGLVPGIVMGIGSGLQQGGIYGFADGSLGGGALMGVGWLLYVLGFVGALFVAVVTWVGSMRISIYDRLSAGFQLGVIWKMMKRDSNGILRIFGMNLLVGLVLGFAYSIVLTALIAIVALAGIGGLLSAGYSLDAGAYMSQVQAMRMLMSFIASAGIVGVVCLAVAVFGGGVVSVITEMLVARALGYWTWQFDVPRWRSQDDPLPFEAQSAPPAPMA